MNKDQVYYARKFKKQGRANRSIWQGIWYDDDLKRYVRISRPTYSHYLKRQCNNKVRVSNFEPSRQKGLYKRVADYWWDLY